MTKHGTLSIAVVSGKGGVGKTNIALNLAYALYRAKRRVLLMDCDLGLANLDVLLGIAPKVSVENVILGEAAFEDAVVGLEAGGFALLPASSGVEALEHGPAPLRSSFFTRLNAAASAYDYLIMDAGAGIAEVMLAFAARAAMRVVVVTPEPTAVTDAYALIKVLSSRHGVTDFHILVNQAESAREEKATFDRLAKACETFLGISPRSLGCIRHDPAMIQAVRRQEPLLKFSPSSPAGKDLVAAAVRVHKLNDSIPRNPDGPLGGPGEHR